MNEEVPRILIIDDNKAIHEDFRKILAVPNPTEDEERDEFDSLEASIFGDDSESEASLAGGRRFHIDSAFQGEEGFELFKAVRAEGVEFELAFVDVRMPPGWDGVKTIKHLWEEDPDLDVVLCTAYSDYSWGDLLSSLGETDQLVILKKPFDLIEVRQLAHAMARKRELKRQASMKVQELENRVEARTRRLREVNSKLEDSYREVVDLNRQLQVREKELEHLASHDTLTGLPNRPNFLQRLSLALERVVGGDEDRFALIFLDLDRFKIVNDSLGHQAGDSLLRQVASRLRKVTRNQDFIARLGGDEFTMLVDAIGGVEDAKAVARRIHEALQEPFMLEKTEVSVRASVGIAMSNPTYVFPEEILRDADMAMYRAKGGEEGGTEVFDVEQHTRDMGRLNLENDLRRGIEAEEFVLYYQPIVDLGTSGIIGAEALVRWNHPERGLLFPGAFIEACEESGLIVKLGANILRMACEQLETWSKGNEEFFMSINVSPRQLIQRSFAREALEVIDEVNVDPRCVHLELVESILINAMETVRINLQTLHDNGVNISLDDFGTGYSSLSFLQRLPVDTLKIDRSFVSRLTEVKRSLNLVRSIISIGQTLGLDIVAEGIEDDQQRVMLQKMGCDFAQGFFFARGLPPDEFTDLLYKKPHELPWMEVCAV